MVFPLLAAAIGAGASNYVGKLSRTINNNSHAIQTNQLNDAYYRYQRQGYERKLEQWNKHVGSQGRHIANPELAYQGHINRLTKDIEANNIDTRRRMIDTGLSAFM